MSIVILDGPMGTELLARGVPTPTPGWSAHALDAAPEVVASIHRDYAAAGAVVHTTNTFRTKSRSVCPFTTRMSMNRRPCASRPAS